MKAADGYGHVAFGIGRSQIDELRERLRLAGITRWKNNTSEGDSVYFQDPDGNKLEAHVGDLESRLESLRKSPYEGFSLCDTKR